MALGRGRFTKRNKKFPGIYVKLPNTTAANELGSYYASVLGFAVLGSMKLGVTGVINSGT